MKKILLLGMMAAAGPLRRKSTTTRWGCIRATRRKISRRRWFGRDHIPESGLAPAGIPLEQHRLQPDGATGYGRDQGNGVAAIDGGEHERSADRRGAGRARRFRWRARRRCGGGEHPSGAVRVSRRRGSAGNRPGGTERGQRGIGGRGGRGQAAAPAAAQPATGGWTVVVSGSDDGQGWRDSGGRRAIRLRGRSSWPSIAFAAAARVRFLRVALEAPSVATWRVTDALFFDKNARVYSDGQKSFQQLRGSRLGKARNGCMWTWGRRARSTAWRWPGCGGRRRGNTDLRRRGDRGRRCKRCRRGRDRTTISGWRNRPGRGMCASS